MPETLEGRIARLEAEAAIRQLAVRYAHAVDARDLDALVALFIKDANMPSGKGPAGVRARYGSGLRTAYRTIHTVSNHLIEFVDDRHARGRVYTRAEEERKDSWAVRAMIYLDQYRCDEGQWLFVDRETHYWYLTEFDHKPHSPGFVHPPDPTGRNADLPHLFPTWSPFWHDAGEENVTQVTNEP